MSQCLHHDVTRLLKRPETDLRRLYEHKRYVMCNGNANDGYTVFSTGVA